MDNIKTENISRNYILITPAKNEGENIGSCIHSVLSQTVIPVLWVLVDDGSTDSTYDIIQDARNEHHWIECIKLNDTGRDLTIHISKVIKNGFDFAVEHCRQNNIEYNYIAFLDADMIIKDKDFFEMLIINFEKDNQLGMASGQILILEDPKNPCIEKRRTDTVSGGEMICKREFFEEINGFPLSFAWESVLRVKAVLNGWKVERFEGITVFQTRETGSAEGIKKGYYIKGASEYYLNYNPLIVLAKGIKYCYKRPYYIGIVYLYGYFSSLIRGKDQIKDKAIRRYFFLNKLQEIVRYHFKIFNKRE